MSNLEKRMIDRAAKKHKKIFPCAHRERLEDCFTKYEDFVFFWYNTEDQSTHVMTEVIKPKVKVQKKVAVA